MMEETNVDDVLTTTYNVLTKRYKPADPRLGRHVRHDSRSLSYLMEAEPIDSLRSVRHRRAIPVLDQGNLGSCTGNAAVGCLGTDGFWETIADRNVLSTTDAAVDEKFAIQVYSEATHIDPFVGVYPPQDTGSDGLSVAQVLKGHGLISGYLHATTFEAALTALSKRAILMGCNWYSGMFKPDADGRLRITGSLAGGHEFVLDELDLENKRVWMTNSWGVNWGLGGRAYFTFEDFDKLRSNLGDITVPVPLTGPPPQPKPVVTDPKEEFLKAAKTFDEALHKYMGS